MEIRYIDPLKDLGSLLLNVEKPARYTGGEYGRLCDPFLIRKDSALKTVIAFPDLYEIGMSNQALRILYNALNRSEGIFCDRAFAPAPDFEEILRKRGVPLYGLDSGISLKNADLLMFTLGYELLFTGILTMLDISGIPLRSCDRGENDPLILVGGPCVSNPLPYSDFIDAFWIGEAEGGFFDLARGLRDIKKSGGKRQALLERLVDHPSVWAKGKGRAVRAMDREFASGVNPPAIFPIPSMKVVHHHGAVEIMRGCPNGCRFCHAGYWYRPMRQKNASLVEKETEAFIHQGGYREITLSSLSSGDYAHLDNLIETLNRKFKERYVSFQLPSLKVSTFSLDLLEKISEVRKSGLTFAVETPSDFWQMAINKQVSEKDLVSILLEAKRRGWKLVKFYFMVGLPLENYRPSASDFTNPEALKPEELKSEEEEIASFIERISKQTGMRFNINAGTFIPKPHTPFQRAKQIDREEAERKLFFLRSRLKPQGHKVGIQDPLISVIEGIVSRGDERAGEIFEEAFHLGCRLDSWNEFIKKEVWEELLKKYELLVTEFLCEKDTDNPLPWSNIYSGISKGYFKKELDKSLSGENTLACAINCNNPCGVCNDSTKIKQNNIQPNENYHIVKPLNFLINKADPDTFRILFSFSKQGSAVFYPHLGLLEIFSMTFIRADIPVKYSQGYNPLPRLEMASPLSLGIIAKGEIAIVDLEKHVDVKQFKESMNNFFPAGLQITDAINVFIKSGSKKYSVSSLLWGFEYAAENGTIDFVKASDEKSYRISRKGSDGNLYGLERISVLARDTTQIETDKFGFSYFEAYRRLYPSSGI